MRCDRVQALSLPLLEELGEALLDFSAPSALVNWLNSSLVYAIARNRLAVVEVDYYCNKTEPKLNTPKYDRNHG
jgi:hypothetical protein